MPTTTQTRSSVFNNLTFSQLSIRWTPLTFFFSGAFHYSLCSGLRHPAASILAAARKPTAALIYNALSLQRGAGAPLVFVLMVRRGLPSPPVRAPVSAGSAPPARRCGPSVSALRPVCLVCLSGPSVGVGCPVCRLKMCPI